MTARMFSAEAFLLPGRVMIRLRLRMPAYMLKLTSSVIVVLTICLPYLRSQLPLLRRRLAGKRGGKC